MAPNDAAPNDVVDLRSDTVTRPSAAMRAAMAAADVGDDGYGEDPTVNRLEAAYAERVGKEAALFVPSGTMANQIALRLLGQPGTRVVAGSGAHVVTYEHGAAGVNSGVQLHVVDDADGTIHPSALVDALAAAAHHHPAVSAVFAEDTHMPSGGRPWPDGALGELASLGPPLHLDGARLFNAAIATGTDAADRAAPATTVMTCLSKGLGAPVGSLLAGPAELMVRAREERKRLGGAMRQAGVLAAAGLFALEHHVDRLAADHARAKGLADAVTARWPGAGLDPSTCVTNVVVFRHPDTDALLAHLGERSVRAGTIAPGLVRLMTHLDVTDEHLAVAIAALGDAP